MSYAITRSINQKEYYLENIYHDKIVWTTDRHNALEFDDKTKLEQYIEDEFPGKKYYITQIIDDDWPSNIIIRP